MNVHKDHRERVRKRYLAEGLDGFADHEALELLLFYAIPRQDVNPVAHNLLQRFGSLSAVMSAHVQELVQVPGVGESAAVLLRLVQELSQKARLRSLEASFHSPDRAGPFLMERFYGEKNETAYLLCLDRKGKLLGCKRLGEGGIAAVALDVRRLAETALLSGASSVILAHNHPSGLALPSQEDYAATDKVRAALETLNITLMDHIIVADGDFVSLRESGYL